MVIPEAASTLTVADVHAIRREAPAVGEVRYLIRQSGQIQFSNQDWIAGIQGVSSNYPPDDELADRSRAGNHAGG